jgi:hypothetical protein
MTMIGKRLQAERNTGTVWRERTPSGFSLYKPYGAPAGPPMYRPINTES